MHTLPATSSTRILTPLVLLWTASYDVVSNIYAHHVIATRIVNTLFIIS